MQEIVVTVPEASCGPKDDLRDAWARADDLRTGRIQTRVYKAPKQVAGLRSAACAYRLATQDVVRSKNRLKAVLRSRGILADDDAYDTAARNKWLKQLPSGHGGVAGTRARRDRAVTRRSESGCGRSRSRIRSCGR
jgi:hypothetical protein